MMCKYCNAMIAAAYRRGGCFAAVYGTQDRTLAENPSGQQAGVAIVRQAEQQTRLHSMRSWAQAVRERS